MRLFVALRVPDEIRTAAAEIQRDLQARLRAPVRWVRPESMHLTLRFLGELDPSRGEAVEEALAGIRDEPFDVHVSGVGSFPPRGRPRVLWAGCRDAAGRLERLQEKVEEAVQEAGIPADKRGFHPHLTLGRARDRRGLGGAGRVLEEFDQVELGAFRTDAFHLIESELSRQGPSYETRASWSLQGVSA